MLRNARWHAHWAGELSVGTMSLPDEWVTSEPLTKPLLRTSKGRELSATHALRRLSHADRVSLLMWGQMSLFAHSCPSCLSKVLMPGGNVSRQRGIISNSFLLTERAAHPQGVVLPCQVQLLVGQSFILPCLLPRSSSRLTSQFKFQGLTEGPSPIASPW
jgi:hypothetical protein